MSTPTSKYRILVIDDTPSIHDDFRKILTPALAPATTASPRINTLASAIFGSATPSKEEALDGQFSVDSALQGEEGLNLIIDALASSKPYALAFVDMRIPPGWDGLETIRHIWAADPNIQIVICTAYSDHSWNAISEKIGHSDNLLVLKKPFDHIEVLQLAHSLTHKWQLARDNEKHLARLDESLARRTYQLSEAEERFSEAFNASPLAQAIIDLDEARFLNINTAFERQFGVSRSELKALTPQTICPALDNDGWLEIVSLLRSGHPIDEHPFITKNGEGKERHMRCSARAVPITTHACAIVVLRDITDQLETERQLFQSQKMEAVGQLSAGIAHDFNNLLTVIHCYTAELLAAQPDPATRQMLEPVQAAASRAATLVRQLLVFSRKETIKPIRLGFSSIAAGLEPLIRRLIGTHIDINWLVPDDLPEIEADPANMEHILVNLVVNARDAMPNGGRITISARSQHLQPSDITTTPDAHPGHFIVITVADTGSGIAPEILPRIFEPFFTTKCAGKGTGLGLSTVYSLVKQHGGWIQVQTAPGKGSIFSIFHPVAAEQNDAPSAHAPAKTAHPGHWAHELTQRFLVVEDDEAVQRMLVNLLNRYKIQHTVVSDGVSALKIWEIADQPFDVLISDIVMPNGLSGLQLARILREKKPTLPIILITGYSESLTDPRALDIPGGPPQLIYKPFNLAQLRTVIEELVRPAPAS